MEPEDHLEGKERVIGDRDTVSRERRALLGARIPTTTASCQSNWGVDAKACHLEDLVHYLQINLGEGRGPLFVPVDSQLNKASPVYQYMLICFVEIGVLRGN